MLCILNIFVVEYQDDKNVAHLTHVSEMQKKIETLSRITQILKDVIQNKVRTFFLCLPLKILSLFFSLGKGFAISFHLCHCIVHRSENLRNWSFVLEMFLASIAPEELLRRFYLFIRFRHF